MGVRKKNFWFRMRKSPKEYSKYTLYKENLHKEFPISPWALFYIQYLSLKSSISLRIKTYFRCIDLGFPQVLTWTFIKIIRLYRNWQHCKKSFNQSDNVGVACLVGISVLPQQAEKFVFCDKVRCFLC